MASLTINLPDDKHSRLKELAKIRGISIDQLMEEFFITAISQFDTYDQFQARSKAGNTEQGLKILDKLDHILGSDEKFN
jgi:predicted transcriptional regulator